MKSHQKTDIYSHPTLYIENKNLELVSRISAYVLNGCFLSGFDSMSDVYNKIINQITQSTFQPDTKMKLTKIMEGGFRR